MDYLVSTGRTFRAERVPLCYMRRFAWASTETRKIVKEEERCIRFLDFKGFIHQKEFLHGKGSACDKAGSYRLLHVRRRQAEGRLVELAQRRALQRRFGDGARRRVAQVTFGAEEQVQRLDPPALQPAPKFFACDCAHLFNQEAGAGGRRQVKR